ncbi:helix-turn-helix domain-containing protein [Sporichthya sp.]|uniref:helix-turn-helix domain-containing protein n=1 Tax=Sporichthya sp. TaxID=65475 RepID=UPI0017A6C49E|nr:helix-turn-helix domain-containing protein [Sporichthya sp.]MBA3743291.1 helix-turn-helix domain-containing protein [Sporichthya sp.]
MKEISDPDTAGSADRSPAVPAQRTAWRHRRQDHALSAALAKRAAGVPTLTVPEAAALLSVSPEHRYRLIRTGTFPAVRMGSTSAGRYVIPAKAIDQLLDEATDTVWSQHPPLS